MKNDIHRLWPAALLAATLSAYACSTPVFQYALQRWEPDYYRAYVFHRGDLTRAQEAVVKALEALANNEEAPVNLGVGRFDVVGKLDTETSAVYSNAAPEQLPVVVIAYPYASQIETPMWAGPLTMATVKALSVSPTCKKMSRQLIEGTATVWVFLPCDDRKLDESTFKRLEVALKETTEIVNDMVHDDDVPGPPVVTPDGHVVQVQPAAFSCSLLRVSRTDPRERILVASLLGSEPDLPDLKEPMVFPVFGRGRALCAFVGKGINSTNILAACEFMGGPCSCQVKAMNPGFDLLVGAYWDDFMDHMGDVVEEEPPELTRALGDGPAGVTSAAATVAGAPAATEQLPIPGPNTPDAAAVTVQGRGPGFVGSIALVLAGMLVVVLIGTAMVALRARRVREE